mgnify:CR=1 FL=1
MGLDPNRWLDNVEVVAVCDVNRKRREHCARHASEAQGGVGDAVRQRVEAAALDGNRDAGTDQGREDMVCTVAG